MPGPVAVIRSAIPSPEMSRETSSEPGVIDDFANEPLDDDPTFRRARRDDDDR